MMKSVVIGASLLVFGGGMRSTDGFQNIMRTFFGSRSISGKSFMKIRSVGIEILGELLYP